MAKSKIPAKLEFENVISMGVSYSWSLQSQSTSSSQNIAQGVGIPCNQISTDPKTVQNQSTQNVIRRTKNVSLDVLYLDLQNNNDVVVDLYNKIENNSQPVFISANGITAGKGRLKGFSIKEGNQSNAAVANLNYEMVNGVLPELAEQENEPEEQVDEEEEPIERTETINVSRDVKNNSMRVEHTVSVNYGNDSNLVSDHSVGSSSPKYKDINGRIALAQNDVNAAFSSSINYSDYIDTQGFLTSQGFDKKKLEDQCMIGKSSSSESKDLENGNFSKTVVYEVSFTGELDVDTEKEDTWEIEYSMSFDTQQENNIDYGVAQMQGVSRGVINPYTKCGKTENGKSRSREQIEELNAAAAQSGINDFVKGGKAKNILRQYFNQLQGAAGLTRGANNKITDLKQKTCVPAIDNAENNGTIEFSFNIDSKPNEAVDITTETIDENISESISVGKDCTDLEVKVIESTSNISAQGLCGLEINGNGEYEKYNLIKDINTPSDPPYPGGDFQDRWRIKSTNINYNQYNGTKQISVIFSDAATNKDCEEIGDDECDIFEVTESSKPEKPRYVEQVTCDGIFKQQKGFDPPTKSASLRLKQTIKKECQEVSWEELVKNSLDKVNESTPDCLVENFNWSYSINQGSSHSLSVSVGGKDS